MQCVMCSQLSCHGDVLVFAVLFFNHIIHLPWLRSEKAA